MTIDRQEDSFKQRDAGSYDGVTDSFDYWTERCSRPMAERISKLAGLRNSSRVLEVGVGTGVVSLLMAREATEGRITGIDLSEGMLRFAADKARREGLSGNFELQRMDAEAMQFPDGEFDSVVSLYALRHFPNPLTALREIRRVLKPGGCAVIGVGSGPSLFSLQAPKQILVRLLDLPRRLSGRQLVACRFIDGLVEKYLPKKERTEEAAWLHHQPDMGKSVPEMVRAAGFKNVSTDWVGQRTIVDSSDDFWDLQLTFSSLARKRIPAADVEAVSALRAEFDHECSRVLKAGGSLVYPTGALIVRGIA
jgi:ubiquinone/menaquinone biosynthesis C-methylase UbiE